RARVRPLRVRPAPGGGGPGRPAALPPARPRAVRRVLRRLSPERVWGRGCPRHPGAVPGRGLAGGAGADARVVGVAGGVPGRGAAGTRRGARRPCRRGPRGGGRHPAGGGPSPVARRPPPDGTGGRRVHREAAPRGARILDGEPPMTRTPLIARLFRLVLPRVVGFGVPANAGAVRPRRGIGRKALAWFAAAFLGLN